MPSLNDIPDHIRYSTSVTDFLSWLLPFNLPYYDAKMLFLRWASSNNIRISGEDFNLFSAAYHSKQRPTNV